MGYLNEKYNGNEINEMFSKIYQKISISGREMKNTESDLIDKLKEKIENNRSGDKTSTIRTYLRDNENIGKELEEQLRRLDNLINIYELQENYERMETSFCSDWKIAYRRHEGLRGKFAETKVKPFLQKIIAEKYVLLENVIIISSNGTLSPEVDLVICSLEYMPPIFENHGFRYIPIESVIGIVQVKIGGIGTAKKHIEQINKQFEDDVSKGTDQKFPNKDDYKEDLDLIRFGSVAKPDRIMYERNKSYYPVRILIHSEEKKATKKVDGYDFTLYVDTVNNCIKGVNSSPEESRLISATTERDNDEITGYLDFMLALNEELIKINNPNIFNYRKYRSLFFGGGKNNG